MPTRFARPLGTRIALIACASFSMLAEPASPQAGTRQWQGVPRVPVPDVTMLHTADEPNVLARVVARGFSHPWSLAFLPNGDMLVTEREGRLRVIRDGQLDPLPVAGVPEVNAQGSLTGLLEVALHPDFARNRQLYLSYTAPGDQSRIALARGRFEGGRLEDVHVVFETGGRPVGISGSRLLFAPDGTVFMPVGGAFNAGSTGARAQDPDDHAGKILRLRDDGSPPGDNPFVGRPGYRPEVFSLGHRNPMGLAFHPVTGELWAAEHAPQGGDEVNVILPGRNYGWPVVSFGREYSGARISDRWWQDEMQLPTVVWLPSVAPSGMIFYTGDRFPGWVGDLFVGSLMVGRIQRTGHIERVKLNDVGEEVGRESILTELRRRIRDVRQGPDGLIYVLTEEEDAVLLRLEPVEGL